MTPLFEFVIIRKIEDLLPEGFSVSSDSANALLRPDAIIYNGKVPVAIVEIKSDINQLRQLKNGSQMLNCYSQSSGMVLKILTDGELVLSYLNEEELRRKCAKGQFAKFNEFFSDFKKLEAAEIKEKEVSYDDIQDFLEFLNENLKVNRGIRQKDFIEYIKGLSVGEIRENLICMSNGSFYFKSDFENNLFKKLLGKYAKKELCRYTSVSTIFRILSTKKASVCSITCMNDRSECFYVDQYLNNQNNQINLSIIPISEVEEMNDYLIMSCSDIDKFDKLTMWRMYGNDAKGVCIKYNIGDLTEYQNFILAPVSYALDNGVHPELEYIKRLHQADFGDKKIFLFKNLGLWKHFFKPYDYIDEQEVRLLYHCPVAERINRYKWITTDDGIICPVVEFNIKEKDNNGKPLTNDFPLKIDSIMLGPKISEKYTNKPQLDIFSNSQNIYHVGKKIDTIISNIENYR